MNLSRWAGLMLVVCLATMAAAQDAAVMQRIETARKAHARADGELAVRGLKLERAAVPAFGRVEARFDVAGDYQNPFDPDDIAVDGLVTHPDGRTIRVPAFFCVPHEPVDGARMTADMELRRSGEPGWRLRFAPDTPGEYRLRIEARDARGRTAQSDEQRFTAEPSDRKGFVRASAANPMYFENSADGSLFWGVGSNVAWTRTNEPKQGAKGPPTYEHYFGRGAGKMTATRVWLCHWAWLEWTPQKTDGIWGGYGGAGHYNQMVAGALDRVFAIAEQHGLRIMLVTEDNDEQLATPGLAHWEAHPYNQVNGGPVAKPVEMYTSTDTQRLYRNRLRYILARWGYSESLWAINSMNDHSNPSPDQLKWVTGMHAYVHSLMDGYRPIIYGTNLGFAADDVVDYRQAGMAPAKPGKPNVQQECYSVIDPKQFRPELHDQLWGGLGRGLAAIMVWNHVMVDRTDAWDEFLPLARFVQSLPLNKRPWKPLEVRVTTAAAAAPGPYLRATVARPYGDVPAWGVKAPSNRFEVNVEHGQMWLEGFSPTIWGDRGERAAWRNPPTFLLNLPVDGKMLIEVSEIGGGTNTVIISTRAGDDEPWTEARTVTFHDGRRATSQKERWVELPVKAGPRQVRIDAKGDWLRVRHMLFIHPMADATAIAAASGWTDGQHAFAYVRNQSRSRMLKQVLGLDPVGLRNVELELGGLADGEYRLELCSTDTGEPTSTQTVTARDGRITLSLPELERDVALRIAPAQ